MPEATDHDTRHIYTSKAILEALDEEMARDPEVLLIGEDIGVYGGAFGVTRGLYEKYGPTRIWETPISENSFVGMAVGAAMMGLKPVVEIMFMDFIALALDQILNSAGKLHYMYNGQVTVPMVIRTPGGAKGGYGPSHSQMLSNLFVGVPGIKVVAPSTPCQAKGLLKSAIRDPNPVLFIENKRLYPQRGLVPAEDYTLPLDRADVSAEGTDLTLIAYSGMVPVCLAVRKALATRGVSVEVVDLVSLQPLDTAAILASVRKTGRAVIVEEACRTGGVGAEVAALIAAEALDALEAPLRRVAAADVPIPSSIELEKAVLPGTEDVVRAVRDVMTW
ncbi:MAG: alpha-ketoacid dehydrogenase subunit beta [Lentisphaerae bacterium]|nr:alpha-ketoacid dehydrogenase subunit beta [Lentisphaerota bacterium]